MHWDVVSASQTGGLLVLASGVGTAVHRAILLTVHTEETRHFTEESELCENVA
jgi:hypothetical protein